MPSSFFIICLQAQENRVFGVLNEHSGAGWETGDCMVDFCSQIQLKPELGVSKEERRSSQRPEQIISAEHLVGTFCTSRTLCSEAQTQLLLLAVSES